jgi:hypothetical protein
MDDLLLVIRLFLAGCVLLGAGVIIAIVAGGIN